MFLYKKKSDKDHCPICKKAFKNGEKIYTDGKNNYHKKCYDREKEYRMYEIMSAFDD